MEKGRHVKAVPSIHPLFPSAATILLFSPASIPFIVCSIDLFAHSLIFRTADCIAQLRQCESARHRPLRDCRSSVSACSVQDYYGRVKTPLDIPPHYQKKGKDGQVRSAENGQKQTIGNADLYRILLHLVGDSPPHYNPQ